MPSDLSFLPPSPNNQEDSWDTAATFPANPWRRGHRQTEEGRREPRLLFLLFPLLRGGKSTWSPLLKGTLATELWAWESLAMPSDLSFLPPSPNNQEDSWDTAATFPANPWRRGHRQTEEGRREPRLLFLLFPLLRGGKSTWSPLLKGTLATELWAWESLAMPSDLSFLPPSPNNQEDSWDTAATFPANPWRRGHRQTEEGRREPRLLFLLFPLLRGGKSTWSPLLKGTLATELWAWESLAMPSDLPSFLLVPITKRTPGTRQQPSLQIREEGGTDRQKKGGESPGCSSFFFHCSEEARALGALC